MRAGTAGVVLDRAGPVAALGVAAVSLAAAALVPLHLWHPLAVLPALAAAAVLAWRLVPHALPAARPAPAWAVALTVAVAAGFTLWTAWTHGEHVVLRRDNGSYALFAQWLATRHGLPVDTHLAAFGGPPALAVPGLTFESPAYFEVRAGAGAAVVPQFLLGAPALFSLGWWLTGGWTGLLLAPALLGGLALLAAGSLTARLVGPAWAPVAAAALGLAQPVVLSARTTFSETPALVLVLGAAALAVDAVERDSRTVGWLAGALAGLAGLVRLDALREVVLLLPLCLLLALRGSRAALPLAAGALGGTAVAALPAVGLSRPYLALNRSSVVPLAAAAALVTVVCAGALLAARRWRPRGVRGPRLLPAVAGGLVALAWVALAARPAWSVARSGAATDPGAAYVASVQRDQGLPVDGTRTYAEQSMAWVMWSTGLPAVVLAAVALTVAAALAARWWVRGVRPTDATYPGWLVPAGVGLGSTVLTLYRPGITPDHPWADRRLVVTVLPAVVLAAVAALAWATRAAARRAPGEGPALVTPLGLALLVLPPLAATEPLARAATERGERRAVDAVCRALAPADVVVVLGDGTGPTGSGRAANEWPQVVRGVCGVPAASLLARAADMPAALDRLAALARRAGHRVVVLAASDAAPGDVGAGHDAPPGVLPRLGVPARRVARVVTTEPPRSLTAPAAGAVPLLVEVWLAPWPR